MAKNKQVRTPHQVLASTSRVAVLELLRERDRPLGVDDVSTATGLHANTIRGHLDVLVEGGYATRHTLPPNGPGRPRVVYEATTAPMDGSNYRLLAEVLTHHLAQTSAHPAQDAVRAGQAWAAPRVSDHEPPGSAPAAVSEQEALAAVMRLLANSGFAPELSEDHTQIGLHHCPFRDLALAHPDVVCGAHLGILQGALNELGAPIEATRLLPLVEPHLCVASLAARPRP